MIEELYRKVEIARTLLDKIPNSYLFAKFPQGAPFGDLRSADLPDAVRAVLEITNGPKVGDVFMFSVREITTDRFDYDYFDGGRSRWMRFANIIDYPLMVERSHGEIWWFSSADFANQLEDPPFERLCTDAVTFMSEFIFGPKYVQLSWEPHKDRWLDFLRRNQFLR